MAGPGDDNVALFYVGRSRIGQLVPDAVFEEVYEDRLQITEHPVEAGSQVADHAYVRPQAVEVRFGWADYKAGSVGASADKYRQFLKMQADREPLTVSTGKRIYKNMLPESITVVNDPRTKWAVIVTARLREVRISHTLNIDTNAPQSQPQSTAPPVSTGRVQPKRVSANEPTVAKPPDSFANFIPPLITPAELNPIP